jgi:hypothetical protein
MAEKLPNLQLNAAQILTVAFLDLPVEDLLF